MVATSSSQALEWWSAQVTPGYILSSVARIFLTRAWRSAAVFGLAGLAVFGLVKIDIPFGRRLVRILLGELQHLVEFLAEHIVVHLVVGYGFLVSVLAPVGFGIEAIHSRLHIIDRGLLLVRFVPDHIGGRRVDVQLRLAAGADNGNQARLRHTDL